MFREALGAGYDQGAKYFLKSIESCVDDNSIKVLKTFCNKINEKTKLYEKPEAILKSDEYTFKNCSKMEYLFFPSYFEFYHSQKLFYVSYI